MDDRDPSHRHLHPLHVAERSTSRPPSHSAAMTRPITKSISRESFRAGTTRHTSATWKVGMHDLLMWIVLFLLPSGVDMKSVSQIVLKRCYHTNRRPFPPGV
jgi:hypothetical protein